MPAASVATTSAEIGPSTSRQISRRIARGRPLSLASRLGFVVMPSTTPSAARLLDLLQAGRVQKDLHALPLAARHLRLRRDDIACRPAARGASVSGTSHLGRAGGRALVPVAVDRGHRVRRARRRQARSTSEVSPGGGPLRRGRGAAGHRAGRRGSGQGRVPATGSRTPPLRRRAASAATPVGGAGAKRSCMAMHTSCEGALSTTTGVGADHAADDVAPVFAAARRRVGESGGR